MDDMWQVVAELAIEFHPERLSALATKVASIQSVNQFQTLRSAFGPYAEHDLFEKLESAWRGNEGLTPTELASALRAASATSALSEKCGRTQLVWTGPSTGLVPIRHTEQVLCELIESARERLFLVSFVAYEVGAVLRALRMACERGAQVDVLLESSVEHGGRVSHDSVKNMKESLAAANFYIWGNDKKEEAGLAGGAVHAKCAVADGCLAFVTSANLSVAAMERNMECGILVAGGLLPGALHRHLEALIATGIVERV